MAISRYSLVNKYRITNNTIYGTANYNIKIHRAVKNGILDYYTHTLVDGERLDQLSHRFYGSASYWWVIAAASRIGWCLQVPAGTTIIIPKNLTAALGVAQ